MTISDSGESPRISVIPRPPMVGRGQELRELDAALARAVTLNEPQTVTLIGGAGIGKTRLIGEFLSRAGQRERGLRSFRAAAHQGGPALGVVQKILRSRFGIADNADPNAARELLRTAMTTLLEDRRVTEFLHF